MITLNPNFRLLQLVNLHLHTCWVTSCEHVQLLILVPESSDLLPKASHLSHQRLNLTRSCKKALAHVWNWACTLDAESRRVLNSQFVWPLGQQPSVPWSEKVSSNHRSGYIVPHHCVPNCKRTIGGYEGWMPNVVWRRQVIIFSDIQVKAMVIRARHF